MRRTQHTDSNGRSIIRRIAQRPLSDRNAFKNPRRRTAGLRSVVLFPRKDNQVYYRPHFSFVRMIFATMGCAVEDTPGLDVDRCVNFMCQIDGKTIGFNCSDDPVLGIWTDQYPIFKFHKSGSHDFGSNVHAFSPISFNRWPDYSNGRKQVEYTCNSDIVLNNQRIIGGAIERRTKVSKMLVDQYGDKVDRQLTRQRDYWKKFNDSLVSVCVPGYCNNMLDRGQLQAMSFGVCTISPNIPEVFPYDNKLIAGQHYVQCNDDYSDLIEKVEWCKQNRATCVDIGKEAQRWFEQTCTPAVLLRWIRGYL